VSIDGGMPLTSMSLLLSRTEYVQPRRHNSTANKARARITAREHQNYRRQEQEPSPPDNAGSISASSERHGNMTGSVRSARSPTPTLLSQDGGSEDKRSVVLSLTPEMIQPLLENAGNVHAMCTECVGELRALLASRP